MAATSIAQQLLGSPVAAVLTVVSLILTYLASIAIYNIYFHPLSKYPGPKWHAASRIPYVVSVLKGRLPFDMLPLHEKYGDIVRIAPNELAISHPDAWKDIAGHKTGGGGEENEKYAKFYSVSPLEPKHIVNAPREEHGRLRRQMANGFSDKMMREQEPLIKTYIDLLIKRLRENCNGGKSPVDIMAWYNWTTFDVIGDLAFGEPFGCLEKSEYHPWVKMIFENSWRGSILQSANHFPGITNILLSMVPDSIKKVAQNSRKLAQEKMARRIERGDRPDLIDGLLKKKDEWNLSMGKLEANANILVIAGSETTATLLSGVTFLLLTNPSALAKLTQEVRSAFESEEDITITSVANLEYLLACLNEALRMYPPVAIGLPRILPPNGGKVLGQWIPGNTVVAVHQYASYHRSSHFTDPFSFHPSRFLSDPAFASDKREILQPFSVGPRNCLGRNLAYAEMRLILARVVWNFDLEIREESRDWLKRQGVWFLWEKGPLWVDMVERSE